MSNIKELLTDASLGIFYIVIGTLTMILFSFNTDELILALLGIVVIGIGIFYLIMGIVLGEADRK